MCHPHGVLEPLLCDTVSLLHFAAAERLDLCQVRLANRAEPRWVEAVQREINNGVAIGQPGSLAVAACDWLGEPVAPEEDDLKAIMRLRVALDDGHGGPERHLGEAESIHQSEKLGGLFLTDDGPAYDLACRRLGSHRVLDTVEVLQEAVAMGDVTSRAAAQVAESIRQAGRMLRRVHADPLRPEHF